MTFLPSGDVHHLNLVQPSGRTEIINPGPRRTGCINCRVGEPAAKAGGCTETPREPAWQLGDLVGKSARGRSTRQLRSRFAWWFIAAESDREGTQEGKE